MSISEFKKRILVADDDNKIRKFLFANLKSLGYEVQTAGDGEEALSLFEATAVQNNLLFDFGLNIYS